MVVIDTCTVIRHGLWDSARRMNSLTASPSTGQRHALNVALMLVVHFRALAGDSAFLIFEFGTGPSEFCPARVRCVAMLRF